MGPQRNYALDGLRGIAALAVACAHAAGVVGPNRVPGGYLAVDFFFILSGLVVDRAYAGRLERGLTAGQFMVIRLYRLYPMLLLGVSLGLVRVLAKLATHQADMTTGQIGIAALFNFLMLPIPFAYKNNFPLDPPAWSLFCEMVANVGFVFILVRAPRFVLWLVVVAGAMAMAYGALTSKTSLGLGWNNETLIYGLARAFFGFTTGMLLSRWLVKRPSAPSAHLLIPFALLVAALTLPVPQVARPIFDLAFAFIVAPLIVTLGARARVTPWLDRTLYCIGILSYPLYTLHMPVFLLVHRAFDTRLPPLAANFALVAAAVATAAVAERLVDLPARRRGSTYLSRVNARPHPAPLGGESS